MRLASNLFLALLLFVGASLGGARPVAAASAVPIKAFFGVYRGAGIAHNADSVYFGATQRDFDVAIRPEETGFTVAWTTIVRDTGTPAHPKVRHKSATLTFTPAGKPGLWRAQGASDLLDDAPYAWARVAGTTLIIYVMQISADGRYEIQRYDRTLVAGGMDLTFTDVTDGDRVRTVKGRMVKVSN